MVRMDVLYVYVHIFTKVMLINRIRQDSGGGTVDVLLSLKLIIILRLWELAYTSVESSCRETVMLLMSSVGGMPGLTDPLASRPPDVRQLVFASPTNGLGVGGVGGVAVAGRTRNDEFTAPPPVK